MNTAGFVNLIPQDLLQVSQLYWVVHKAGKQRRPKGWQLLFDEAAKKKALMLKGARVVIQGFGNAGSYLGEIHA